MYAHACATLSHPNAARRASTAVTHPYGRVSGIVIVAIIQGLVS